MIKSGKIKHRKHLCLKNWNSSSTSMENDIIVKDMKYLYEVCQIRCMRWWFKHNVKSKRKSSIRKICLKIECANHVIWRFRKGLERLELTKGIYGNIQLQRKSLKQKIPLLVNTARSVIICYAIPIYIEPSKEHIKKFIEELQNISRHVFGNHASCGSYCSKKSSETLSMDKSLPKSKLLEEIIF